MLRIVKTETSILTILDAPIEDDSFQCVYEPFFKDFYIDELEDIQIATREGK